MKPKTKNKPSIFRMGKAALLASCALLITHVQGSAATIGVDLGADGIMTGATIPPPQFKNAGAFALGANLGSGLAFTLQNSARVVGDVAVAGNGRVCLEDTSMIQGNLAYTKAGTLTKAKGATITGTTYHDTGSATAIDSLLNAGVTAAINASNTANGFAATAFVMGNKIVNQNLTLSVADNMRAVYKLTDLTLNDSYKLTLQGTSTSAFVIDVSNSFSLATSAKIQLSGGLTWDHVLFNLTGTKKAALTGSSMLTGIVLAANRTFDIEGSAMVNGAVIANQIDMDGSARITRPPIVSP